MVLFEEWIKAGIMNVADIVTSEGIAPYESVCRLIGQAPQRILQCDVVRTAVRTSSHTIFTLKL